MEDVLREGVLDFGGFQGLLGEQRLVIRLRGSVALG